MSNRPHWRKPKGSGGSCVSQKLRWVSLAAAETALTAALASKDPKRMEQRTYECSLCGGWHLTSSPQRDPDEIPDRTTPCRKFDPEGFPCSLRHPHPFPHRWTSPVPDVPDREWWT